MKEILSAKLKSFSIALLMLTSLVLVPQLASANTSEANTMGVLQNYMNSLIVIVEDIQDYLLGASLTAAKDKTLYEPVDPVDIPSTDVCVDLQFNLYKGLRDSNTNGEVSKLQSYLSGTGDFTYPRITGYYGPATEKAVKKYQARNGIVSSGKPRTTGYGVVGPLTRAYIKEATCFSEATLGELRVYKDSVLFFSSESTTREKAYNTCSQTHKIYSSTSFRCTWNGIEIYNQDPIAINGIQIFDKITPPTEMMTNGDNVFARFSVTASGGNVDVEKITLNVAESRVDVTDLNVYAYTDSSFSTTVPGIRGDGAISLVGKTITNSSDFITYVQNPLGATSSLVIIEGRTLYFEVRGTVSGANTTNGVITTVYDDNMEPLPLFILGMPSGNATPEVTVISPNGGESFIAGSGDMLRIVYNVSDVNEVDDNCVVTTLIRVLDNKYFAFPSDSSSICGKGEIINGDDSVSGSLIITSGYDLTAGKYLAKVSILGPLPIGDQVGKDRPTLAADVSDTYFELVDRIVSTTTLSLDAGSVHYAWSPNPIISGTAIGIDSVKVAIFYSGVSGAKIYESGLYIDVVDGKWVDEISNHSFADREYTLNVYGYDQNQNLIKSLGATLIVNDNTIQPLSLDSGPTHYSIVSNPIISGTAIDIIDTVKVLVYGAVYGSLGNKLYESGSYIDVVDGKWADKVTSSLADGEYSLNIHGFDQSKNLTHAYGTTLVVETVAKTVTLDEPYQVTTSQNPIISGTAVNTATVGIALGDSGGKAYGSGTINVVNGRWSVQVSPPLAYGSYSVHVYVDNKELATGRLIVDQGLVPMTLDLTSPSTNQTFTIGDTIPIKLSYSGAQENSQVVVDFTLVDSLGYNVGGVGGGKWQSPELRIGSGEVVYNKITGLGYLTIPGIYKITGQIRNCVSSGCNYSNFETSPPLAETAPLLVTILPEEPVVDPLLMTLSITSPYDDQTYKIGYNIPISLHYEGAQENSQIVVGIERIGISNIGTVTTTNQVYQSGKLSVGSGEIRFSKSTGLGELDAEGVYRIMSEIRECSPYGCSYFNTQSVPPLAESLPVEINMIQETISTGSSFDPCSSSFCNQAIY